MTKDAPSDIVLSTEEAHEILDALEGAARHLSAVDVSNAEMNCADVRYRPLTAKVIDAAGSLLSKVGREGVVVPPLGGVSE